MNDFFRLALGKLQEGSVDQAAQLDLKVLSREHSAKKPRLSYSFNPEPTATAVCLAELEQAPSPLAPG